MSEVPTKQWLPFNMNSNVKIKLTPRGVQAFYEYWGKIGLCPKLPEADADGYITQQLWCVMQMFGPVIALGRPVPFETEMYFEVREDR
jgi:hypothetical protein